MPKTYFIADISLFAYDVLNLEKFPSQSENLVVEIPSSFAQVVQKFPEEAREILRLYNPKLEPKKEEEWKILFKLKKKLKNFHIYEIPKTHYDKFSPLKTDIFGTLEKNYPKISTSARKVLSQYCLEVIHALEEGTGSSPLSRRCLISVGQRTVGFIRKIRKAVVSVGKTIKNSEIGMLFRQYLTAKKEFIHHFFKKEFIKRLVRKPKTPQWRKMRYLVITTIYLVLAFKVTIKVLAAEVAMYFISDGYKISLQKLRAKETK